MDSRQFISYIHDPGKLSKDTLDEIAGLNRKFPYCQSLQILHLLNLKMTDHLMYREQLNSTAAHIADRKRLRELIKQLHDQGEEKVQEQTAKPLFPDKEKAEAYQRPGKDDDGETEAKGPEDEPVVPVIEIEEEERLLRLKEIVENRLKEIQEEKKETAGTDRMSKEELIERFIREEPSISRPKTDFFNPVKVARSSQEEQAGLVSETLANIHIQQGNIEKAIEIYRRLSLNFPEKSSYFAARIEKLKSDT